MKMKIGLCSLLLTTGYLFGATVSSQPIDITKDSNLTLPTKLPIKKENPTAKIHQNELVLKLKTKETRQIQQNKWDIQQLKLAVAKLITEVNSLKQQNKQLLKEKQLLLKKKKIPNDLTEVPIENSAANILNTIKTKKQHKCRLVKERVIKNSSKNIMGAYKKYNPTKEFLTLKSLHQFKYPTISSKKMETKLKAGQHIEADMHTRFGWVHVKGGGWVAGYFLYPKVVYKAPKNSKKAATKYIYKKVCD